MKFFPISVEHDLSYDIFVHSPMSNLDTAGAVMGFAMNTAGIPDNFIIPDVSPAMNTAGFFCVEL